jgi:hypothetical protein
LNRHFPDNLRIDSAAEAIANAISAGIDVDLEAAA